MTPAWGAVLLARDTAGFQPLSVGSGARVRVGVQSYPTPSEARAWRNGRRSLPWKRGTLAGHASSSLVARTRATPAASYGWVAGVVLSRSTPQRDAKRNP